MMALNFLKVVPVFGRFGIAAGSKLHTVLNVNYSSAKVPSYETLSVQALKPFVFHVELNRPKRFNALSDVLWNELKECFDGLSVNPDCRVVVLSGSGKHFTAGIDLQDMLKMGQELAEHEDVSRKGSVLRPTIKRYQDSISSLELCVKPVITVVHSACVGAGVDLITAADIRFCTNDAWFQVKEVEIGMAADVGTLQRLPKIVGNQSLVRELCYTARKVESKEALDIGLVSRVFPDKDSAVKGALELAEEIASKSPVAVQNTKRSLVYANGHTAQQGLDHIALINELHMQSEDFVNAVMAQATKGEKPVFSKL